MRVIKDNFGEYKTRYVCPHCHSEVEVNWRVDWQDYIYYEVHATSGFKCPACDRMIPVSIMAVPSKFRYMIVGDDD